MNAGLRRGRRLPAKLAVIFLLFWPVFVIAAPISLPENNPKQALGEYASFMKETGVPLTISEADIARTAGEFSVNGSPVISFGIGTQPVWIHLPVTNSANSVMMRRLLIENSWLDKLDVYFLSREHEFISYHVGDSQPYSARPVPGRFFMFDHDFQTGITDIYLRVETADPIVMPIFLLSPAEASQRNLVQAYSYGLVYGYLLALLAYNTFLYAGLRNVRYLNYAAFLTMFILMNLAYTGHGFVWLWPEQVTLQRWVIPVFMVLFGASGLAFALNFLETRSFFPRTHQVINLVCAIVISLMAAFILSGSQHFAILLAFFFINIFSIVMLALGVLSLYSGYLLARYFLMASLASMMGTAVTSLSVLGYIPFNEWTFRAVEIGMIADATLLALALAHQFRANQVRRILAEQLAGSDPLTGLNNRRALLEKYQPIWSSALRNNRNISLIIFDLDHFKSINDQYGHSKGDDVLVETGKILAKSARQGDILARWGGEEFLLLLPETHIEAATALAERLRKIIAGIRVSSEGGELSFTASFGVVQRTHHETLDSLISDADRYMYKAKKQGRNRVCSE
ncbi:diguanylate cyclase [Methylicorpusculum sp.]|uniref:sensor domain-containing diguanylate cyclase n=1 Tax=Methylicorpusculum sp. TaxID=2713644 RepID=UPI002731FCF4|nr:diguanylate cyclase [Methylicorpusculum sp.]MDP2178995.1 diguanylate cyclase [Methylicorpusculum sp.]MDP3528416.1 diguanylate cyclase [Methylicorpusculum sp.]MDZ4153551.1 diguanylate cyclase [Methylicorpusculum sp.]